MVEVVEEQEVVCEKWSASCSYQMDNMKVAAKLFLKYSVMFDEWLFSLRVARKCMLEY